MEDEQGDLYAVLQVSPTAEATVIRAVYRALATQYHPDHAGAAGERLMRELNAAWEVLGDPRRRAEYDAAQRASGLSAVPDHGGATVPRSSAPAAGSPEHWSSPPSREWTRAPTGRAAPFWTGSAGPPPGRPSGSVLDFGVFAGWSLGEIARRDPGYLQWLQEKREGRPFLPEIDRILRDLGVKRDAPQSQTKRSGGLFHRRR